MIILTLVRIVINVAIIIMLTVINNSIADNSNNIDVTPSNYNDRKNSHNRTNTNNNSTKSNDGKNNNIYINIIIINIININIYIY